MDRLVGSHHIGPPDYRKILTISRTRR